MHLYGVQVLFWQEHFATLLMLPECS